MHLPAVHFDKQGTTSEKRRGTFTRNRETGDLLQYVRNVRTIAERGTLHRQLNGRPLQRQSRTSRFDAHAFELCAGIFEHHPPGNGTHGVNDSLQPHVADPHECGSGTDLQRILTRVAGRGACQKRTVACQCHDIGKRDRRPAFIFDSAGQRGILSKNRLTQQSKED